RHVEELRDAAAGVATSGAIVCDRGAGRGRGAVEVRQAAVGKVHDSAVVDDERTARGPTEEPRTAAPGKAAGGAVIGNMGVARRTAVEERDRKSTRLNSSHLVISYAVFCLKKKNNINMFSILQTYLYITLVLFYPNHI